MMELVTIQNAQPVRKVQNPDYKGFVTMTRMRDLLLTNRSWKLQNYGNIERHDAEGWNNKVG
jgi:hypothetical protein